MPPETHSLSVCGIKSSIFREDLVEEKLPLYRKAAEKKFIVRRYVPFHWSHCGVGSTRLQAATVAAGHFPAYSTHHKDNHRGQSKKDG